MRLITREEKESRQTIVFQNRRLTLNYLNFEHQASNQTLILLSNKIMEQEHENKHHKLFIMISKMRNISEHLTPVHVRNLTSHI